MDRLRLRHAGILGTGALLGLVLAGAFLELDVDPSAELERARELGIVSRALLDGRPPSGNVRLFACLLGFPVATAVLPWWLWARRRRAELRALFPAPGSPPPRRGRLWIPLGAALALFLSFELDKFLRPGFNASVGAWIFLSEEGSLLEWAQRVLQGEVYGRDFACGYGPMLVYPLAGALRLFGESVVVERAYAYALNLAGYAIALAFLHTALRNRRLFLPLALFYLLSFNMLDYLPANTSLLRIVLGLLPLLLLHRPGGSHGRAAVLVAGAVAGQSLLVSQEAGLCGLAAGALYLLLETGETRAALRAARRCLLFAAGALLSLGPWLLYLARRGALRAALESFLGFPALVALGFGSLPFPELREFLAHPLSGGALLHYWILLVYAAALVALLPLLLLGRADAGLRLRLALALFGVLLFRIALGRSDDFNAFKASHPAFLLAFLGLDAALAGIGAAGSTPARAASRACALGIASSLALLALAPSAFSAGLRSGVRSALDPLSKLRRGTAGIALPELERAGVRVDEATAEDVREIRAFLDARTQVGDYVYFFPNEAVYYFLFERRNPTRYGLSYVAITARQRRELVGELEARRPAYAIFSREAWRVDGIPLAAQAPEVIEYLERSYRPLRLTPRLAFLKRKDA